MNVDHILATFNEHQVQYLLIGGMNFMLRHKPILTYDLDIWIADSVENRHRCEAGVSLIDAEWGATEESVGAGPKPGGGLVGGAGHGLCG